MAEISAAAPAGLVGWRRWALAFCVVFGIRAVGLAALFDVYVVEGIGYSTGSTGSGPYWVRGGVSNSFLGLGLFCTGLQLYTPSRKLGWTKVTDAYSADEETKYTIISGFPLAVEWCPVSWPGAWHSINTVAVYYAIYWPSLTSLNGDKASDNLRHPITWMRELGVRLTPLPLVSVRVTYSWLQAEPAVRSGGSIYEAIEGVKDRRMMIALDLYLGRRFPINRSLKPHYGWVPFIGEPMAAARERASRHEQAVVELERGNGFMREAGPPDVRTLESAVNAFRRAIEREDSDTAREALAEAQVKLTDARYRERYDRGMTLLKGSGGRAPDLAGATAVFEGARHAKDTEEVRAALADVRRRVEEGRRLAEDVAYAAHFNRGVELFGEGAKSSESYKKAKAEFEEALKHKDTEEARQYIRDCDQKWNEWTGSR